MFKQIAATAALLLPLTASAWETTRVTPNSFGTGYNTHTYDSQRGHSYGTINQNSFGNGYNTHQFDSRTGNHSYGTLKPNSFGNGYEVKTYDW